MNRRKLEKYAPQARRDFIQAVTQRAALFGISLPPSGGATPVFEPVTVQGDLAMILGRAFPRKIAAQRRRLEERIARQGFEATMEAIAYSWFNRLAAIRYMELHGYLDHGYRVLSHPEGRPLPEILEHAAEVDLPGLDTTALVRMQLEGTREAELYRMLLVAQCNALHQAMPFLFEKVDDETELLLPDNLLHSDSLVRRLTSSIDEEDWREVEIIGWLYQFYISEKKDEVIGKVVRSEDIPAATQLFTPNWIVKYLVQNSLGRQWMATYPDSPLRTEMEYYIEPAEQTPEVQEQLRAITPERLNPEELTLLDPACGSGHILVEAYGLFKSIYRERGYAAKDIPELILTKNLYGLEIDDRAAQLAAFALMMKAREDNRTIFRKGVQPRVISIQESTGLKAAAITEALNRPLPHQESLPSRFLFQEMEDAEAPLFSRKNAAVAGAVDPKEIAELLRLFEHGKTFGSLIRVPDWLAEKLPAIAARAQDVAEHGELFDREAAQTIIPLVEQAQMLARKYDAVVANPPYMGIAYFTPNLRDFISTHYEAGRGDLYAAFILSNLLSCKDNGYTAMITIPNWMTITTFEPLRDYLINNSTIESLIDNGRGIWGADFGSCAFIISRRPLHSFQTHFKRLYHTQGSVNTNLSQAFLSCSPTIQSASNFNRIPGKPIAYWVSDKIIDLFRKAPPIGRRAKKGLSSGQNEKFIRYWFEIDFTHISINGGNYWYPIVKGGSYRRWYGNYDFVINWRDNGYDLRNFTDDNGKLRSVIRNAQFYFRPGITWNDITISRFSARWVPKGFIPTDSGPMIYEDHWRELLCMLNSVVNWRISSFLAPTAHFTVGTIASIPALASKSSRANGIADEAVSIAKEDWDSLETSYGFSKPLILFELNWRATIAESYDNLSLWHLNKVQQLRELEEENNRIFIQAYGLQDELSPEVPEDQITLYRPDREEDIKRLISYAVGCMMGRYSLDVPGLVYAHSGNRGFDPSRYATFPADADGIIPVTDAEWFDDDAANRFFTFVGTVWPKETLEENLEFVAESIAPGKGEQSREAIRRYMATGFFKHHLSLYKRRPIYWLFSSGKLRAFQCLVYLHRYNEGTLSRMRTEYVIPLQGKIAARVDLLKDDIASAASTSHRRKLEKERELLVKQAAELHTFDEKLRHYADMKIGLDLDDGVKVNYGKFGDLLAEVKAVTGGKED